MGLLGSVCSQQEEALGLAVGSGVYSPPLAQVRHHIPLWASYQASGQLRCTRDRGRNDHWPLTGEPGGCGGGAWHPDSQVLAEVSADHLRPQSTILQVEAQFNHSPSKLP